MANTTCPTPSQMTEGVHWLARLPATLAWATGMVGVDNIEAIQAMHPPALRSLTCLPPLCSVSRETHLPGSFAL